MREEIKCNGTEKTRDCDKFKKDCQWIWRSAGADVEKLERVCKRDCEKVMKTEKCQKVKR